MSRKTIDVTMLTKLAAGYTALEDARYNLSAVGFWLGPKGLDLMATDGHTLFHGHLRSMTSKALMTGLLTGVQAARGEEPDMQPAAAGATAKMPQYQSLLRTAVEGMKGRAITLYHEAPWKDWDWALKLWGKIGEASVPCMALRADEDAFVLWGKEAWGMEMEHKLSWPQPSGLEGLAVPDGKLPACGINAQYARRLCGTALSLPVSAWTLAWNGRDNGTPHVARTAWDGGEVDVLVMPVRL